MPCRLVKALHAFLLRSDCSEDLFAYGKEVTGVTHLAIWGQSINQPRKSVCQILSCGIWRNPCFLRQICKAFAPQGCFDLVGRDRSIFPGSDPGGDDVFKPISLESLRERG